MSPKMGQKSHTKERARFCKGLLLPVTVRMKFDLTGLLPASPVRKDGCKGSNTKMADFLTGKPGKASLKKDIP
jgi:hypothetical protein